MTMLATGWLAGLLVAIAGCGPGAPPGGSRAAVAVDHLEKQRARIERIQAGMKTRPSNRSSVRR